MIISYHGIDLSVLISPQTDVFISYKWSDGKDVADRLAMALKEHRVSVWKDNLKITHGDKMPEKIEQAIAKCKVFVPVFTEDYFMKGDKWCRLEFEYAHKKGKKVVPLFWQMRRRDIPEGEEGKGYNLLLAGKLLLTSNEDEDADNFVARACVVVCAAM